MVNNSSVLITDCYYIDRVKNGKHYAIPKRLATRKFSYNRLLDVIASELDRKYFGIEVTNKFSDQSPDEFIDSIVNTGRRKRYNFLILIGEGDLIDGTPSIIRTRLKNRVHRSIFLEMRYTGNGIGYITECNYYDRKYKERVKVVPETLSTIFFPYNRESILKLINNELNVTPFTDIIFVTDGSLDVENEAALCGNI